ncbi:MAG TPA: LLM class flavin-dependent oxidoreductase [Candidatus Limnocylindrales bacterium]|nr:LLM class flavin-dependent oxidoreductase [Candidatus Limnocylindrales bacterium]
MSPRSAHRPADPATPALPIGVVLGTIGVDARWWLDSARRLDAAGYAGIWSWDHFVSRGDRTTPVLEAWTMLSAAAAVTARATVGTFVANVMNRHPAVLARMAATLAEVSGDRFVLGIGIGGHPAEHEAYGIEFPDAAARAARLREAIAAIRALWSGGPVSFEGASLRLTEAHAFPVPDPPPEILVGAGTPAGVRLAARHGDGWAAESETFATLEPRYREALDAAGRDRADQRVVLAFGGSRRRGGPGLAGHPLVAAPREEVARWQAAGADDVLVTARTTADVDALVAAAERW